MDDNYITYRNGGYVEFMGPHSVTKPTTGFTTGIWTETDTGDVYFYDFTTGWTKQFSFQD